MLSILKTIGMGMLYTLLSPFILLVLALYFIYTFLVFIGMFFVNIFKFFKGKSVTDDLPIEKQAKQILEAQEQYETKLRESILNNNVNMNPTPNPIVNPNPTPYPNPNPIPTYPTPDVNNQINAPTIDNKSNNEGGEFND